MPLIHHAAANADWEELARKAHWLKGSAGTMGFHEMTEPALQLERHATAEDATGVAEMLQTIDSIVSRIVVPGASPVAVS